MRLFSRPPAPESAPPGKETPTRRLLFLDDDPARAEVFLAENPAAVWIQTAAECIAKLGETWDEVHLDHDLGGEHFVDLNRDDCGMEVVRWLCVLPRHHLRKTRFHVHSHNPTAAMMMGMQLMMNGFDVSVRPFGTPALDSEDRPPARLSPLAALGQLLRRVFGREDYGYSASRLDLPVPDPTPLEPFDFNWPPLPSARPDGSGTDQDPAPPSSPGAPRTS